MRDGWVQTTLGEVAVVDCDRTRVVDARAYAIAGVLNAGKGLFARETIAGSDTNYPALHRLHEGQIVMRKLTAFEGAITCVPDAFDGWFVSPEFPTFTLDRARLDPAYMRLVCRSPSLWDQMWLRSTGTVQRRKRVNPGGLLGVPLLLPPLADQRRIIDLAQHCRAVVKRAEGLTSESAHALRLACWALTDPRTCDAVATIEDVSDILDRLRRPVNETERLERPGSVPYYGANGQVGTIDAAIFDEPLVLVAEDGGFFEDWRTKHVAYAIAGPAWVNNHAHVLRAREVSHEWLHFSLRHRDLTDFVNFGTRPKLNQSDLRRVPVGIVADVGARVAVLSALDELRAESGSVATAAAEFYRRLVADLLSSSHEIPDSYDVLLERVS